MHSSQVKNPFRFIRNKNQVGKGTCARSIVCFWFQALRLGLHTPLPRPKWLTGRQGHEYGESRQHCYESCQRTQSNTQIPRSESSEASSRLYNAASARKKTPARLILKRKREGRTVEYSRYSERCAGIAAGLEIANHSRAE